MNSLCESCGAFEVQWILKDQSDPNIKYKVCSNCLIMLVSRSLSPQQYFNLLKNNHDENEFLLHSDFYDDHGNALQPVF